MASNRVVKRKVTLLPAFLAAATVSRWVACSLAMMNGGPLHSLAFSGGLLTGPSNAFAEWNLQPFTSAITHGLLVFHKDSPPSEIAVMNYGRNCASRPLTSSSVFRRRLYLDSLIAFRHAMKK